MDLIPLQYLYIGLAAFLVGFTKTSVGGVGILAVLLMALAIPGKASPGVLLPMLIAADIMAVIYYRRECQWNILLKLLPPTLIGLLVGYFFLLITPDVNFERTIGWVILAMLGLDVFLTSEMKSHIRGRVVTGIVGVLAGASSMIANAAGPVFGIYLLQMDLKKSEFVGTRSWFFLTINIIKVPLAVSLGLVTPETLTLDLLYLPVILLGAVLGYKFLAYINVRMFGILIRIAVLAAAMRLIFS